MTAHNRPVGILGGTFDPIHHGHLRLALEVLEQCELEQVRIVPNGAPPHRATPSATPLQRLEMTQLAIQGTPGLYVDKREFNRTGPSYMVDTLGSLRTELGESRPLCLLVGSDAFLQLPTWHQWQQLFELAHLVVIQRPGQPLGNAMTRTDTRLQAAYQARLAPSPRALHEAPAGAIVVLDMPLLDISATDIRRRTSEGRSLRHLTPDSVAWYIHTQHLYLTC